MKIDKIESLTIREVEDMRKEGKAELIIIKGHACYLVDLKGYFGYSVLVFKNNHHIHYANDYQLHHRSNTIPELKQWYVDTLNNKLFTESELMEEVHTYNEYTRKNRFVRNYWIMQFDYISAFCIGKPDKEIEKARKELFYCPTCFCYVKDKNIIDMSWRFISHIEKSFDKAKKDNEVFRKMISYELANHEACITCDYRDALDSLGLKIDELTEDQKQIVKEELKKQIDSYC
ncbi:DUF7659 family protein [Enterocloster bolteae]|uniref:DUF7659 family protein n=1 Tax=Enterocloster bolteae TaxID=208479 RepID=UPI0034A51660